MLSRLAALGICLLMASPAQAAVLRVHAEAPFSVERWADAIRTYVEGAELEVPAAGHPEPREGAAMAPGVVEVVLRRQGPNEDGVELVLFDGEVTILSGLPGAMRIEDLYRTAALKVHALLQRRMSASPLPTDVVGGALAPVVAPDERLMLDAGLALLLPSAGGAREGLRLGGGLRLSPRWHVVLGAYLEPRQSTRVNEIDVSTWELPLFLAFGFDWHQGRWSGWLDGVGHAALRLISAQSPSVISNSDLALSPRAGGATGLGVAIGRGLHVQIQVALLAVLADTRYRVDEQEICPSARAVGVVEAGVAFRGQ